MGYERIVENAYCIREIFGTRDPFKIANELGILVEYHKYDKGIRGYCTKVFDKLFIVINSIYNDKAQRIICAHELGHAILHSEHLKPVFSAAFEGYEKDKLEYEANIFAAALLLDQDSLNTKISTMSNYALMSIFNENLE